MKERIDYPDIAKHLGLSEVFSQKITAVTNLSGRYDQGVPPGELKSILDEPRTLNNILVNAYWVPYK